jgi:hypothetical protein
MGFVPRLIEFGVKFNFLLKILCKLHEKMVEICPIWWPHMCFGLPSCIELSLELK